MNFKNFRIFYFKSATFCISACSVNISIPTDFFKTEHFLLFLILPQQKKLVLAVDPGMYLGLPSVQHGHGE